MKSLILLFTTILGLTGAAPAELVEKNVEYRQGDAVLEGFHVYDGSREGKRPAVLVIHQWTGLSDYEKHRSRMLAAMGYNVFAADIYGKGIRPQPPASGQEAGKYKSDRKLFRERLLAALEVLRNDPHTAPSQIAAIGYCFGGTGVLELARSGTELSGVVSFHGGLDAAEGFTATEKNVKTRILVLHGADDPYVPAPQVEGFEKEMKAAAADYRIVAYPGAVHSFTQKSAGNDPAKGAAYHEEADHKSWEEMKNFFNGIFSSKTQP